MRAVLWDLLLLCLFAHVLGDCQRDCLSCDRHMYSQWDGFNVLVCVLECEGQAVPRATWELCAAASAGPREEEEEDDDDDDNDPADVVAQRPGARPPAEPRRLAAPAARGVQKRYGGFIGVRKSARKWNNQKRFSEFLKQYLGMSPRSTFRHRVPAPATRHRQN
ncbi:prepronociceptin [Apteryx rowi]|uniref:prepronociceptin n=1 Tax=Apteryx rowi TaxID=308060 RepID=UPI000E1D323C|nr:prepronociceptin [Apteryx rowi]